MKTKLLMTILSASFLLFSGSTAFAATESLAAPSATLGSSGATANAPFSKNVTGRYTGGASGISYEAGVYHSGGTREFGTGSSYTSVYRKQCTNTTACGTITTAAGGSVAINFSTAATWTAQ